MKKNIITTLLFCSLLMVGTLSCNKETFIESIGYVNMESGDDSPVSYFIFTSVDAASKCGKLSIYIDDKLVGTLTKDYNGNMSCTTAPVEGEILKVVASTGSHSIRIKYGENCEPDVTTSYNLQQGTCRWYYIQ